MFDWLRRMNEDQAEKVTKYCVKMVSDEVIEALNSEVKTHHSKGSEEDHSEAVKEKSSGG